MNVLGHVRTSRLRFLLLCGLTALAFSGCDRGSHTGEISGLTRRDGTTATPQSEGEPPPGATLATTPQAAFLYTAVLEQAVIDAWSGRGQPHFEVIYVLDGVVAHVRRPTRPEDPRHPFPAAVKQGMQFLGERSGLPPIEFVPELESALRGPGAGRFAARVKNRGLLVSLGRIRATPRRAEVGTSLWVDVKAMQWITYVVKERGAGWRVVGTTGLLVIC